MRQEETQGRENKDCVLFLEGISRKDTKKHVGLKFQTLWNRRLGYDRIKYTGEPCSWESFCFLEDISIFQCTF